MFKTKQNKKNQLHKDQQTNLLISIRLFAVLELLTTYLGCHVVRDAELKVCEDALHTVEGLLPCGSQVLLHGPGHRGKDGLGCLSRIHYLSGVLGR